MQKYFIESWLLPCSLRSHRIANPTPQNELRHFAALPTHHPSVVASEELAAIGAHLTDSENLKMT